MSAPCLSFQHAHDQTVSGGEVNVLTPGDYGVVKIDRAITIDGGNMAYITVHGLQKGIDVEPAATGATVVIRNLSINSYAVASVTTTGGVNTTNVGIYWGNGQILHIEGYVSRRLRSAHTKPNKSTKMQTAEKTECRSVRARSNNHPRVCIQINWVKNSILF